jgi:parvulin-like peptidyl-prolyl isomerase
MKRAFVVLALGAAFAAAPAGAAEVFATVDGAAISAAEFEAAVKSALRQKFYHREVPEAKLDEFRREVGESLIDRLLLLAEISRRGMTPDAERVQKEIAQYERRYAQSEQWKKNREATLPGLAKLIGEREVLERLQASVRAAGAPGEADLTRYYESHKEFFTEPEQARLSIILLKVDPASPGAAWALAREEAQAIRRRLAAGADFAQLARIHSSDGSAAKGGDLGYLHQGMIPEVLFGQLGAMKPGDLSEPQRLLEGVALFRLEDRKPARLRPLQEVKERAVQLWQRDEGERRWREFVAGLRAAASIRIDITRYPALAGVAAAPGAAATARGAGTSR